MGTVFSKWVEVTYTPTEYNPATVGVYENADSLSGHLKGIDDKFRTLTSGFTNEVVESNANGTQTDWIVSENFGINTLIDVHVNGILSVEGEGYDRDAGANEIQFISAPAQHSYITIRVWQQAPFADSLVTSAISPGGSSSTPIPISDVSRIDVYKNGALQIENVHWTRDNNNNEIDFPDGTTTDQVWRIRVWK